RGASPEVSSSCVRARFPRASRPPGEAEGGGLNKYQPPAADAFQPPLRYGFRARLRRSVAMTSNGKSWSPRFSGHQHIFCPRCIGRSVATIRRRLLLRLSVGWLPPSWPPSGAGLALGTRILYKPLNAAEDDTTPGRRLF